MCIVLEAKPESERDSIINNTHHALVDYEPSFNRTANRWTQSMDSSTAKKIDRFYNERVNDYQKNISQSIFSPGQTLDYAERKVKTPGKYKRRIGGHRKSINEARNMKTYKPLRGNAVQLNKKQKARNPIRPRSNKTYRSAHSFSRKLDKEKR